MNRTQQPKTESSIDDLGSDANAGPLTGFVMERYEALRGDGKMELSFCLKVL